MTFDPKAKAITHYLVYLPSSSTSKVEIIVPRHYLTQPHPSEARRWDVYDILTFTAGQTSGQDDEVVPAKKVYAREWVRESIKARKLLPSKEWHIK